MSDWGTLPLLADTSAWARVADRTAAWERAISERRIVTCAIVELELLYSARSRPDVMALLDGLDTLRHLPVTQSVAHAAVRSLVALAERGADGSHRVPPADALIAACAEDSGCAVLHYDHHYDRLAQVLGFTSVWLAPPGTLG